MRKAIVKYKMEEAGILTQADDGSYTFAYLDDWVMDPEKPSISPTLPKQQKEFSSPYLFPFFYHIAPEGINKRLVCKDFKIDEYDIMGILLHVAQSNTIGAVTIHRV